MLERQRVLKYKWKIRNYKPSLYFTSFKKINLQITFFRLAKLGVL